MKSMVYFIKKNALFFFTAGALLIVLVLLSVSSAKAQFDNSAVKSTQSWSCLESTTQINTYADGGQQVQIQGRCESDDDTCYIVTCITSETGSRCTTGINKYDQILNFGSENYTRLQEEISNFRFQVFGDAKQTSIDNRINTKVHIASAPVIYWTFFAVGLKNTAVTNSGDASTLEYGTFEFENSASCVTYRADPYGVVFDSQSLEPLPDVSVTLMDSNKTRLNLAGVPNPVTTLVDGLFNFVVPAGTYFLSPSAVAGYSFEANPFIHPNYVRAYSNIYKPDEAIVEQQGIPEHRDIALNPGVNTPYRANPVNMNYGTQQLGDVFKITGKQSHPLTVVTFRQGEKEIASTTADRYGFYEINLPNRNLVATALIDVFLTKVDLTATEQTATPKKSISIEPQPPYIEGRATGKNGAVIPKARVRVKLKMSDATHYEVEADANGVFVVPPQNVPVVPYYLEITPPNSLSSVKLTTIEFAKLNADYLAANNIDLMAATKNGRVLIEKRKPTSPSPRFDQKSSQVTPVSRQPHTPTDTTPLLALIVALGLVILVAGVFFYLKHKAAWSSESTAPTPPVSPPPLETESEQ